MAHTIEQNLCPNRWPQASALTLLAVVHIVLAVLGLMPWGVALRGDLPFATMLHIRLAQHTGMNVGSEVLGLFCLGVPMIVAGIGLLMRRPWGRYLTLILAAGIAIQVAINLVANGPHAVLGLYAVYPVVAYGVLLNRRVVAEFRHDTVERWR